MENNEIKNYLPGDPELIDKIVFQLKLQGLFDEFRKECLADVDTKPAYQNLRQRVDSSVAAFLNSTTWCATLNKKNVRENLRKHVYDCKFLDMGVERIVEQVVNPKICSVFMPKVEQVVYQFLGIKVEPNSETETLANSNKWSSASGVDKAISSRIKEEPSNLLPEELEPISPDHEEFSDNEDSRRRKENERTNSAENTEIEIKKEKLSPCRTETTIKEEDEISPAFELHNPKKEGDSGESELSGISDLTSHGSPKQSLSPQVAQSPKIMMDDSAQSQGELLTVKVELDESEPMIDASAISPLTSSSVGSGDSPKMLFSEKMFDETCASYISIKSTNEGQFDEDSSDSDAYERLGIESPIRKNKMFEESSKLSDTVTIKEEDTQVKDFEFLQETSNFTEDNRKQSSESVTSSSEASQDENKKTSSKNQVIEYSHQFDDEELSIPKTPTIHYENSSGSIEFETVGELKETIKKTQKSLALEDNSVTSFEDCLLKTSAVKVCKEESPNLDFNKREGSNLSIDMDNNSAISEKENNFSDKTKHETSKLYERNSKESEKRHSYSHKSSHSSRKDSHSKDHRRSHSSRSKEGRDSSKDNKEKSHKDAKEDSKESKHAKEHEHKSSKDTKAPKSKDTKVYTKEPKEDSVSKENREHAPSRDTKANPSSKDREKSKDSKSQHSKHSKHRSKESSKDSSSSDKSSKDHHRSSSKESHDRHKSSKEAEKKQSSKDSKEKDESVDQKSEKSKDDKKTEKSHKDRKNKEQCSTLTNARDGRRSSDRDNDGSSSSSHRHSKSSQVHGSSETSRKEESSKKSHKSSHKETNSSKSTENTQNSQVRTRIIFPVLKHPLPGVNPVYPCAQSSSSITSETKKDEIIEKPCSNNPIRIENDSFKIDVCRNSPIVFEKTPKIILERCSLDAFKRSQPVVAPKPVSGSHASIISLASSLNRIKEDSGHSSADTRVKKRKIAANIFEAKKLMEERRKAARQSLENETRSEISIGLQKESSENPARVNVTDIQPEVSKKRRIAANIFSGREKVKERKMFRSFDSVEDDENIIPDPEYLAIINAVGFQNVNVQNSQVLSPDIPQKPETVCKISETYSEVEEPKNIGSDKIEASSESIDDTATIENDQIYSKMETVDNSVISENNDESVIPEAECCARIHTVESEIGNCQDLSQDLPQKPQITIMSEFKLNNEKPAEIENENSVLVENIESTKIESKDNSASVENDSNLAEKESDENSSEEEKRYKNGAESSAVEAVIENGNDKRETEEECNNDVDMLVIDENDTEKGIDENDAVRTGDDSASITENVKNSVIIGSDESIASKVERKNSADKENDIILKDAGGNTPMTIKDETLVIRENQENLGENISEENAGLGPNHENSNVEECERNNVEIFDAETANRENSENVAVEGIDEIVNKTECNERTVELISSETEVKRKSDEGSLDSDVFESEKTKMVEEQEKQEPFSSECEMSTTVSDGAMLPAETAQLEECETFTTNEAPVGNEIETTTSLSFAENKVQVDEIPSEIRQEEIMNCVTVRETSESQRTEDDSVVEAEWVDLSNEEMESDPKDLLTKLRSFVLSRLKAFANNQVLNLEQNSAQNFINHQFVNYVNNFEKRLDLESKIKDMSGYFEFDSSLDEILRSNNFKVERKSYISIPEISTAVYSHDESTDSYIFADTCLGTISSPAASPKRKGDRLNDENVLDRMKPKKIKISGLSSGTLQVSETSVYSPASSAAESGSEALSSSKSVFDLSAQSQLNDSMSSPKYDGDCSIDDSSILSTPSKSLTAQLINPALESLLAESGLGLTPLEPSGNNSSFENLSANSENAMFSLPLTPESDSVATQPSPHKSAKRLSGESNSSAKKKPSPVNAKNVPPMKQRNALVESSLGKLQRYDNSDLYKPRPLFSQTSRRARSNNPSTRDSIGVENESDNPLNPSFGGKRR